MEEMVSISKEEYERLVEAEMFLDALYETGVEDWDGFDEAMSKVVVRSEKEKH